MGLAALVSAVFAGLVVFVKRQVSVPSEFDGVLAAVAGLLSQLVLLLTVLSPDVTDAVQLIFQLALAILGALGVTQVPSAFRVGVKAVKARLLK